MSHSIFLALVAEHKQRTRHDIFTQGKLSHVASECDVCLYLHVEWRKYQEAEHKYYLEQNEDN